MSLDCNFLADCQGGLSLSPRWHHSLVTAGFACLTTRTTRYTPTGGLPGICIQATVESRAGERIRCLEGRLTRIDPPVRCHKSFRTRGRRSGAQAQGHTALHTRGCLCPGEAMLGSARKEGRLYEPTAEGRCVSPSTKPASQNIRNFCRSTHAAEAGDINRLYRWVGRGSGPARSALFRASKLPPPNPDPIIDHHVWTAHAAQPGR